MIFLLIGGSLVFLILVIFLILRNQLIRSENLADAAFADIDVQLVRRHELIPKLVEIASGYAKHEAVLLEEIAKKRTGIWDKDDDFPQILNKINVIKEANPDLKADQTFEKLLSQIIETQNHLLYSRQFYNGVVEAYNGLQEKIPYSWFAKSGNHSKRNYVHANSEQHEIPNTSN